jgi:hypothetical protein
MRKVDSSRINLHKQLVFITILLIILLTCMLIGTSGCSVTMKPITVYSQIGPDSSYMVDNTGVLWAWGRNFNGQLVMEPLKTDVYRPG